ncbi:Predicted arabinose efflux permease, MFS family [Amycolatopsis xylanica]|uniref:Predicted arabinose efflux permease, MFS family n=1 Tax=Amycolatopsis xylanica TaxID=589385 RepID=A0A1H3H386_9PSEU|nr:MFS transporter [Amycolatopsis xylanica]SDY09695.1 Predicted arabinose efflux permease, MFS family [Amycolatopsis xylanica]
MFSSKSAVPFAVAAGLAVANVYYAPPLLGDMAAELGMAHSTVGVVTTATQVGYGLGLVFVAPLGDRLDRRRLVGGLSVSAAFALAGVACAPAVPALLAALAIVGVLAVLAQVLVAYAAVLAEPADRGRIVGVVTSGIVLGILLARTVAGVLADWAGWRSVYLVSAAATLVTGLLLYQVLPRSVPRRIPYPRLITSTFRLFAEVPMLRIRAVLALLIFMALNVLLAPMALPLSAPPLSLSTTEIGLFGLAGAAGALGAARAGRLSEHAQRTTRTGLLVMLASWLPIALLPSSIWLLVLGVIAFDFGLQSVHVANQSLIYRVRPDAQSRLTAAYMLCYSLGSAAGAITSTLVHAAAGWAGVSALGAAVTLIALLFWAATKEKSHDDRNRRPADLLP